MPERRFSEKEIAEIFEQAATIQNAAHDKMAHREGLTLAELQEIGQAAGITPDFVSQAVASIQRVHQPPPPTRMMGQPISVSHTVDLTGALSDRHWERLVIDLQETFHARGTVRIDGRIRSWNNGNLTVVAEPTQTGHRLRMRTLKGNVRGAVVGGVTALAMSLVILIFGAREFSLLDLIPVFIFMAGGLGVFGGMSLHLKHWRAERERQMKDIAARAQALLDSDPAPAELPEIHTAESLISLDEVAKTPTPLLSLEDDADTDAEPERAYRRKPLSAGPSGPKADK